MCFEICCFLFLLYVQCLSMITIDNFLICKLRHLLALLLKHSYQACLYQLLLICQMWLHISWVILRLLLIVNYLTRWVSIFTSRFHVSWPRKWRIVLTKSSCVYFIWWMIQLTRNRWKETPCTSCYVDILTPLNAIFDA